MRVNSFRMNFAVAMSHVALKRTAQRVRIQIFRIRRAHAIDKNMSFAVKVPTALTNYLAVSGLNKLIIAIKNEVDVFIVALCM